ncbi:MAG: metalloregulator ArsR/SmtB family transcription factor [Nitrospirae bacterium]|nr:metalloregulator ArsR/SmtB family transcription factor [Nitrospirota bacterium]
MKNIANIMKLFSDPARLRIMMLLTRRELCVCQIMGVLDISQPLVSRNLSLLSRSGFLRERKEGKLVFYSLRPDLSPLNLKVIGLLRDALKSDTLVAEDLRSLKDCEEFQKKTGRCDMKTFFDFMDKKRKRSSRG